MYKETLIVTRRVSQTLVFCIVLCRPLLVRFLLSIVSSVHLLSGWVNELGSWIT